MLKLLLLPLVCAAACVAAVVFGAAVLAYILGFVGYEAIRFFFLPHPHDGQPLLTPATGSYSTK